MPVPGQNRRAAGGDGGWHEMLTNVDVRADADDEGAGDTPGGRRWRPPTPAEVGLAAALCFLDEEPDERIARRLGIARRTLARWKRRPEIVAAWAALSWFHRRELERRHGLVPGRLG